MKALGFMIATFILATVAFGVYHLKEKEYYETTTSEMQDSEKKLAEKLNKLPAGTFLRQKDGSLVWICPKTDATEEAVYGCTGPGYIGLNRSTTHLARRTDHIILPETPKWDEAAREFLIPKSTATKKE